MSNYPKFIGAADNSPGYAMAHWFYADGIAEDYIYSLYKIKGYSEAPDLLKVDRKLLVKDYKTGIYPCFLYNMPAFMYIYKDKALVRIADLSIPHEAKFFNDTL